MKLIGFVLLLGPTLFALQNCLRRPADSFPVGNRLIWASVLVAFGAIPYVVQALASFIFIAPFVYLLMVVVKSRQERQEGQERPGRRGR